MQLYATKDVQGTLSYLPDPRLAPTPFAVVADDRANTIGAQVDKLLAALGLSPNNGGAIAQAEATTATIAPPAPPMPLLQRPVVLFAIGAAALYYLTRGN